MSTIKINSANVLTAYKEADPLGKKLLENLVGDQVNFNLSIIDRTPTVEAALDIAGKSIAELTRPTDCPHETALRIIETVIKVLWEGVPVDYSNDNQDKYEPRFYYKAGLGLSYFAYFVRWTTNTDCGPRLCYPSYDTMIHGIKILAKYYNIYNTY